MSPSRAFIRGLGYKIQTAYGPFAVAHVGPPENHRRNPVFLPFCTGLGCEPAFVSNMKAAVFLERDGVLNQVEVAGHSQMPPMRLEEFHIREDVCEPLLRLKAAGYLLLVTTNQPNVGRGLLPRRELDRMHDRLRRALPIDEILLCAHEEGDRCNCHKPSAGLFTEAAFSWHLDMERSFAISDKWQDAAAAFVSGCNSVLIKSPWNGSGHHDFLVNDFDEACQKVLQFNRPVRHLRVPLPQLKMA